MKPYEVAHRAIGKAVGVMTGSRLVRSNDNTLHIIGLKASRKYREVVVKYDEGKDLFDMSFFAKRTNKETKLEGLFFDQLREVFESKTGLYASL